LTDSLSACRCGYLPGTINEALDFPSELESGTPSPTPEGRDAGRTSVPGGAVRITHQDLAAVAGAMGMTPDAVDRLWNGLYARDAGPQRFGGQQVPYYFGALLVVAAMGYFTTLAWNVDGGFGMAACALAAGVAFWFGRQSWRGRNF
jgi:hypothetical protein